MNIHVLKSKFPIVIILVLAFVVRLYEFSAPVGDWHSWRQADTSAVSRNFVTHGYDLLHPRFDDLSNVPSKLDNPEGYRFVEFPLYNALQAGLSDSIGMLTLEQWGRMVSIIASLISTYILYRLLRRHVSEEAGLLTAFFYAFFPFTIYYGRTILPDTSMVASSLAGVYFFDLWIEKKCKMKRIPFKNSVFSRASLFFLLSLLSTTLAFLLKPYALFFTLPMIYLAWKAFGRRLLLQRELWVYLILSVTPLLLWRQWMMQYPEGIPANAWLLNGNGIRFRPAFFRWMGYERLVKLISGYGGVLFLFLGAYQIFREKSRGLFLAFFVSCLLYVCIFASGNVQHDYYQILIMPTIAIFYGLGAYSLLHFFSKRREYIGILLVASITFVSFFFSWKIIKDYFNINNPDMIQAGKMVDKLTPKNARVIALYEGDTSFLYQTKRKGWANMQNPLPTMIEKGADYLVMLHPSAEDIRFYSQEYPIVASSSAYILVALH